MSYVPREQIFKRHENIYKLVLVASKRALELSDGATPLVPKDAFSKTTTIALNEIMQGKIGVKEEKVKSSAKTKKKKG